MTRKCLCSLLLTLMLTGCQDTSDEHYQQGRVYERQLSAGELASLRAELAVLQQSQRQAALDAACTTSWSCSIAMRLRGIAPPAPDRQYAEKQRHRFSVLFRAGDAVFVIALTVLFSPLAWLACHLGVRRHLTRAIAQATAARKSLDAMQAESLSLAQQHATLVQAREVARVSLQTLMNTLKSKQDAMNALHKTKRQLELSLIKLRKEQHQLQSTVRQPTLPALAESIFAPAVRE